jgi:hypothetical protein
MSPLEDSLPTDRSRLTLYLPAELIETYKVAAVRQHISVSRLIEQAMVIAIGGEIMVKERRPDEPR